jgi:peptidyl-prolyl cis-trans isomerase A (cyclophilin A)
MQRTIFIALALFAATLSACGGEEDGAAETPAAASTPATEAPIGEVPTEAVTPDGTRIIFAGPHRARDRQGVQAEGYDEDTLIREPNLPDPVEGDFDLEDAVVGMPIDGDLVVEIGTPFGAIFCDLYADRAPNTVANFIGLARGLRPFWDARAGEWLTGRPFYQNRQFFRVVPEYLIQTGDYLEDGSGTVGYTIEDELHDTLSHDRAGQLCMANRDGPDSAGGQFFITDGPHPELDEDGMFTVFGQCRPEHVISQIARVPQDPEAGNRPITPIEMTRVLIRRVEGGAAQARATGPRRPEGEPEIGRGASPPPGHARTRFGPASPLPTRPDGTVRRGPPRGPIFQRPE